MCLPDYDIIYLGKKAEETGFIRDTLEKVVRLADILEYLNTNPLFKESLALKGGTAINLTIFNLPRLSVDIDMDYSINNDKEEMLREREKINKILNSYMVTQGYSINRKSKTPHSLDSWVYDYMGASGNRDNIKIEVNYSMRSHVLPIEERTILSENLLSKYKVRTLAPIEIFGSKINALFSRAAARDLYDTYRMIKSELISDKERVHLRKVIVFYAAISAKTINKEFCVKALDIITENKIKRELYPVITRKDEFSLEPAKKLVKAYISDLMKLTEDEHEFLERFESGEYMPQLLFKDKDIIECIKNHPMAVWKTLR